MDKFQGMNRFLAEKLRAPTMTAHNAPDGGDIQLADAAQALVEETQDEAYTPPFPVPLMRPLVRGEGMRGEKTEVWLCTPTTTTPALAKLVGGGVAEKGLDFPINSIMVDNFTPLWGYFPEQGIWVPPFNFGRVFRGQGSRVARVKWEQPSTQMQNAAAAGTSQNTMVMRVQFYEELLPENTGLQLASTNT